MKAKKSWREKLAESKGLPSIQEVTGKMSHRWGTGKFVIPAPMEVDEIMKKVPRGKLTTINQIRTVLAEKHGVNFACPITSGIFAWVAANAAEEEAAEGKRDITPYWRTLKSGGELNPKYPGGVEAQAKHLTEEGHEIIAGKGKKPPRVKDFENYLEEL
jgi:alkylated DNA nucleotide flippase Atl1